MADPFVDEHGEPIDRPLLTTGQVQAWQKRRAELILQRQALQEEINAIAGLLHAAETFIHGR